MLTFVCRKFAIILVSELSFKERIMQSTSPLTGGEILAFGKHEDFVEKPKWRTK